VNKTRETRRCSSGKESIMCYEFSEWYRKARTAAELRAERERAGALKRQAEPAAPVETAAPQAPTKELETLPG
jgi:hypothetical protein